MHQPQAFQFVHNVAVFISLTTTLATSLVTGMVVTPSKTVARPGEEAELICQSDTSIQECSFFGPEDIQDKTREASVLILTRIR